MSEPENDIAIRRILVALDASPHSRAALEAAVDLAARFEAELHGLFVEDENLLRAAELPFVQEVGLFTATSRQVGSENLQRQIRVQSRTVRRIFSGTSRRAHVRTEFHVVRGAVLPQVLSAASEADVLVLGRAGSSLLRHGRLGSTVRGLLPKEFGLALIVQAGARPRPPLAVFYDGSAAANRAVQAAKMVNQGEDAPPLLLVLLAGDRAEADDQRRRILARLGGRVAHIRFRWLPGANALQLASILQAEGTGTLVMPAHAAGLPENALVSFLEHLELPILLVT